MTHPFPTRRSSVLEQPIGVLHLVDRLLVLVLGQLGVAPVPVHAGMQEILVDRGQLVVEHLVEKLDDLGITLHGLSSIATDPRTIQTPRRDRKSTRLNSSH